MQELWIRKMGWTNFPSISEKFHPVEKRVTWNTENLKMIFHVWEKFMRLPWEVELKYFWRSPERIRKNE